MNHSSTWNPYWTGLTGHLNQRCQTTSNPSNVRRSVRWHCARSACVCHLLCVVWLWHTHWFPFHLSLPLFLPGMLLSLLGEGVSGGGCHNHLSLVWSFYWDADSTKVAEAGCLHPWLPPFASAFSCDWQINDQRRVQLGVKTEVQKGPDMLGV